MREAHSVDVVRAAEGQLMARLPEGALMARAAAGLAVACGRVLGRVSGARVTLLVGSGDNGGDTLFAGARLARRGAAVRALLAGSRVHTGGLAAFRGAGGRVVDLEHAQTTIDTADLLVDGLVGIGGRGGLRAPHADLARAANAATAPVVAVDLPSGIDADTGEVDGVAVWADVTVTFGTHKPGLLIDPGAEHCGVVDPVDIGLGPWLPDPRVVSPTAHDVAGALPRLAPETHKYTRGVLGIAAGSGWFPGAAVLVVGGAFRAGGAGLVHYTGDADVRAEVLRRWPETVVGEPGATSAVRATAWAVGSGRGTDGDAEEELAELLAEDTPVLLDADALTVVARHPTLVTERVAPTVLTPHAGELARLLPGTEREAIEAARLAYVTRAAEFYGATVLLKGSTTVIADPAGPAIVNPTGTALLATAGSGDVLSGMIGSFLAAGMEPRTAAMSGAFLHGLAARLVRDGAPISASDLFEGTSLAINTVNAAART
ncbi:NAD(P)H-hydrate dehydratase [Spiractinospora alimapuensis]|uniref:NAD(P)H-hydrate dehydratase n=1 Tax=Spiractinospora alimapuensis TaxID=2820884 RepID=UPI001EEA9466|nr:NAD(P)H-hydrate dehydratase [Spiractinospora alimapuensis]QVQ51083.1 NAD(P)H-hydrate dehydratase [Spiractinospora alimapuensis]